MKLGDEDCKDKRCIYCLWLEVLPTSFAAWVSSDPVHLIVATAVLVILTKMAVSEAIISFVQSFTS